MIVLSHGLNSYHSLAYGDPEAFISRAAKTLAGIDYSSMVGTGLSGALVVPILARALGKDWAIVRKENDGSHSSSKFEGRVTDRWIFVDDFISTGDTYKRVRKVVAEACARSIPGRDSWIPVVDHTATCCVGSYEYQHDSWEPWE